MQSHPAADLFPLLTGPVFDALVSDIKTYGLREPIVLHPDGRILDGRNRYHACEVAGIAPTFREWNGNGGEIAYVVSRNLHRRHLDESQRAMVGERLATMRQGERTDLSEISERFSQAEAADLLHVSPDLIGAARKVRVAGAPELVHAVESGDVAVSTAAVLTNASLHEQRRIVAAGAREVAQAARQIRKRRQAKRPRRPPSRRSRPVRSRSVAEPIFAEKIGSVAKQIAALLAEVPEEHWTELWDRAWEIASPHTKQRVS